MSSSYTDKDAKQLMTLIERYVSERDKRHNEVAQILAQDNQEYLPFKLVLASNPELRSKILPDGLVSLADKLREQLNTAV